MKKKSKNAINNGKPGILVFIKLSLVTLLFCFLSISLYGNNKHDSKINSTLQQATVTGLVTDGSTGEPLPGVYVRFQGTNTGTVTDADGRYSLQVTGQDAVIVFSFISYQEQIITVGGRAVIDIVMQPDIQPWKRL
jgi:hypothetical protein